MSHTGTPDGAAVAAITALNRTGQKLAVAESLTGGTVCAALTGVPGTSEVFVGGIIAYSVELKRSMLGVPQELLDEHGPVDAQVARVMAVGVGQRCGAELGVATTGVAGPSGHGGKPPGMAYIGWSTPKAVGAIECRVDGDRDEVRAVVLEATLQVITQCAENGAASSRLLTAHGIFVDRE